MKQKIGIGYDIHRLVPGRKLYLGGIAIPHDKGLEGHSDADVLIHAVCDAILGALGKGDIGEHFPNTDAQYKNISSRVLLSKVNDIMKADGFMIGNLDTMVLAEEPKLQPFKKKMSKCIAETLQMDDSLVNVKATTQEGLGFAAGQEGISAYATVLLFKNP